MRSAFNVLTLFIALCGACFGAGFLSGSELIAFFPSKNLVFLAVSGLVFFLGYSFSPKKYGKITFYSFLMADVVFAAATLSGIDGITRELGFFGNIPAVSLFFIGVFHLFLSENIRAVERANLFITPAVILIAVICAFIANSENTVNESAGLKDGINAALYAFINLFVTAPTVILAGRNKSIKVKIISSALFSVVFIFVAFLILKGAVFSQNPLSDAVKNTVFFVPICIALILGSFTSFAFFIYPVKGAVLGVFAKDKTKGKISVFCLYLFIFLLSRVNLTYIIRYLYPIVGGAGAIFTVNNIVKGIKSLRIKMLSIGDTKIKDKRRKLCLKKEKPKSKNLPKRNTVTI